MRAEPAHPGISSVTEHDREDCGAMSGNVHAAQSLKTSGIRTAGTSGESITGTSARTRGLEKHHLVGRGWGSLFFSFFSKFCFYHCINFFFFFFFTVVCSKPAKDILWKQMTPISTETSSGPGIALGAFNAPNSPRCLESVANRSYSAL